MRHGLQFIERCIHSFNSAFRNCLLRLSNTGFDLARNGAHLLTILVEGLLHLIDQTIQLVSRFDLFALGCVFARV